MRLLNEELDKLSIDASERSSSVINKASFLAVSAGVAIGASTSQIWKQLPIFALLSLALAGLALVCAAAALRPGLRVGISAQRLTDQFIDSTQSAAAVERAIVIMKSQALTSREVDLRTRATWIWVGFFMLTAAAAALTITFAFELF